MVAALMPLLGACAGEQSALDPAGPSARAIALVWWAMLAVGSAVMAGVMLLWALAWRRARGRSSEPEPASTAASDGEPDPASRRTARWFLVGGGLLLPSVTVAALLAFGLPAGLHQVPLPGAAPAPLRIEVVAERWGWQVRYPAGGPVLRNELRLPAGVPVDIAVSSADLIHSFWVPRLGGKLDAIPGRVNVVRLQADAPGRHRGQCAEYCGIGHAGMTLTVEAMEAAAFDAWLRGEGP